MTSLRVKVRDLQAHQVLIDEQVRVLRDRLRAIERRLELTDRRPSP